WRSPEHGRSRVANVDHVRERAAEPLFITRERCHARGVAACGALDDFVRRQRATGNAMMIALERRSRQERFDAAGVAAKAWIAGPLVIARPRQGIMSPFAGDRVRAIE